MTTSEKLQYIVEVQDKALRELQNIEKQFNKLQSQQNQAAKSTGMFDASFGKLVAGFSVGTLVAQGLTNVLGMVTGQISNSIGAATQYQSVLAGLASTSAAFGIDQQEALASVKSLTEDGMISQATAANGLQKLFQAGLNLPQAIDLMGAYKDQAVFGKVASLSMDQAVNNLAESFMTESSMIGNLSGQTENYSLIVSRGAAIMGKQESELTNTERTMAKYLGTMQLAEVVQGDTARAAENLAGIQAKLGTTLTIISQNVGSAFLPAIQELTTSLLGVANTVNGNSNPALEAFAHWLLKLVGNVEVAAAEIGRLAAHIGNMMSMLGSAGAKLASFDFAGAWNALEPNKQKQDEINATWDKVSADISSRVAKLDQKLTDQGLGGFVPVVKNQASKIPDIMKDTTDKVAKEAERLAKKLQDIADDTAKTIRDFEHSVELRTADFQRSLDDVVRRHIETIADLRKSIQELNDEFAEGAKERAETHDEKTKDIIEKYQDETQNLKENLERRLADNTGSDEKLIAFFEAQIAEKDKLRDEEIAEEDARYAKEEAKQQASLQKRQNELQTKLNEELEIQKKHQAEFDAVKDKAAEDDITRLQNSFAREMDELKRQHNERMEELRKEQEEILALKAVNDAKMAKSVASSAQSRSVNYTLPQPKTLNGQALYGPAFADGGIVPGQGEVPILAHGGEVVLNKEHQMALFKLLEGKGSGGKSVVVNQTNNIYEKIDMTSAIRELGWRLG